MPETPPKPPPLPVAPDEEMGWDLLDDFDETPADPFDEDWSEVDDEGTDWQEKPGGEADGNGGDWEALEGAAQGSGTPGDGESASHSGPEDWADEEDLDGPEDTWPSEMEGPTIVGWSERASLPVWGIHHLPTRCSTDQETSTLHVMLRPGLPGRATLVLGDQSIDVGVGGVSDDLVALTTLRLLGQEFEATLRLVGTTGQPHLILGRDVLAGRFLVDPSLAWTQRGAT
jgi:hypothetical protein